MKLHRSFPMLILGMLLAWQCNHSAPQSNPNAKFTGLKSIEIPKLLDRVEVLRNGTEWDAVQNMYSANAAQLRKEPDNLEARLKLSEVFIQEARVTGEHPHYYPAALQMLEPVITALDGLHDLSPEQKDKLFRALSHKASVQLSQHDFESARLTAEKAVAINPYNAYIYGCLVDANVELGHYQEAVVLCDKMVGIRPDLRSYARVSYLREIYGDINGAIEAMDMAVKAGYPGYEQTEWARLQLGQLYARYGNEKAAEDQFNRCLAMRENYPFALAALAGIENRRGNKEKAEKLLLEAIAILPEVSFYIDLSKIYQSAGRNSEAEKLCANIERMIEEDINSGHNMNLEAGRFHLEVTKNIGKGMVFVEDEIRRRPGNKDVNQLLGACYLTLGKKAKAAIYLKKAAGTGSKDPELLALLHRI